MRDNNIDLIREAAILATIFMEGGDTVVNDCHDKGGTTKYGISQAAYPELKIEAITLKDAIAIYTGDYWNKCRCDEMPGLMAILTFDLAVTSGARRGITVLQQTEVTLVPGLPKNFVDGLVGTRPVSNTLNRAWEMCSDFTHETRAAVEYTEKRMDFYRGLKNAYYEKGWLNRAMRCLGYAMGILHDPQGMIDYFTQGAARCN